MNFWPIFGIPPNVRQELDELWYSLQILCKSQEKIMALQSDVVKKLQQALDAVKKLAALKIEREQENQQIITGLEEIISTANEASSDDASQGSSTGAGSGAQVPDQAPKMSAEQAAAAVSGQRAQAR